MPPSQPDIAVHVLTPDGQPLRGVLEVIPACSSMTNLHIEADGSLGFDFLTWLAQWFEEARPQLRAHPGSGRQGFVFVDFVGDEHHEDDLLRCRPGNRLADCPHCHSVGS